MKISVLIPAFNASETIGPTIESALGQTVQPDEILVMNDGSTDNTAAVLELFKPRVTVLHQSNKGVASARNELVARAQGDLLAFIDADDIWHSKYLEVQRRLLEAHPGAVASFTAHVNFGGEGEYRWNSDPATASFNVEVIPPLDFLERYNNAPGVFMCLSHCCFPKNALSGLGSEPFKMKMAEDSYFLNLLAPRGPVLYAHTPLVAYRVLTGSLSSDRVALTAAEIRVCELLQPYYMNLPDRRFLSTFRVATASKRRSHAKILLGIGKTQEARKQLWRSLGDTHSAISAAKSAALLFLSCLPSSLQPVWPPPYREVKVSGNAGQTASL
jgi:glycosyltransferase involved in cell wall biosynthesis